MLALLNAIKAALIAGGAFQAVYLTERIDDEWDAAAPAGARTPMAAIADAGEDPPQDLSGGRLRTLRIKVAVYVSANKIDKDGLIECLTLAEGTEFLLSRNLMGLAGCRLATYQGSDGSDLVEGRGGAMIKKTIAMSYELVETG